MSSLYVSGMPFNSEEMPPKWDENPAETTTAWESFPGRWR